MYNSLPYVWSPRKKKTMKKVRAYLYLGARLKYFIQSWSFSLTEGTCPKNTCSLVVFLCCQLGAADVSSESVWWHP